MSPIESFRYKEENLQTVLLESVNVCPGVICDVYIHPETNQRDLGIIHIEAGAHTPPQKVLLGDQTIEGFISGKGRLIIIRTTGEKLVFEVENGEEFSQIVEVGEVMQWQADEDLVAFEICYPPYQDGRYENLENQVL